MADYHCHFQIIGRAAGHSATGASSYRSGSVVAGVAYRSGEKIVNEYDGVTHDYTRKQGVVYSEIILPDNAKKEFYDRSTLWNAVEKKNNRCNSQLAREADISLQREFTLEENIEVVRKYITKNFTDKGVCADFSIHDKGDGNPHVHIMLTMNDVSEKGFGKRRSEEQGQGYFKREERLMEWRKSWADISNEKFKEKGLDIRIDHRTLEEQGLEREPTIHVGHSPERAKRNAEIIKRNEKYKPAAVVEYMQEIQDAHDIVVNQVQAFSENRREADKLNRDIDNIIERKTGIDNRQSEIEQARAERASLKAWQIQEKQRLDMRISQLTHSIENGREYFKNKYKIEYESVNLEIQRKKAQSEQLRRELTRESELINIKGKLMLEYQRQRLLAQIRPDGREILNTVKPSQLDRITDDDFKRVLREVNPYQAKILLDMRQREYVQNRTHARFHERTR